MLLALHIIIASSALLATFIVLVRRVLGKNKIVPISDFILVTTAGTIGTGVWLIVDGAPLGRVCAQALALTFFSFATLYYENRATRSTY